jgi:sigma-B regulation protein RsbU (phosphoserine phosphatase)
MLKGQGYRTELVDSPQSLLEMAQTGDFDLILADLNYTRDTTSGSEGLDLLTALDARGNRTPVVVMTAWGSIDLAVEAMQRGACDFIQKPWDNARALAVIEKQAGEARKRHSEMDAAASVQQRLFPAMPNRLKTLDYAGVCHAASIVGGDYYDFLDAGENGMAFLLADVSGKGVPAALLMANLQACFRSRSPEVLASPAELLRCVNRHFFESTPADRFATLFYGVYDDSTRRLRYVNCGHCPALLIRNSGHVESLQPNATIIGAFEEWMCMESDVALGPGDLLVLYSDGVSEATNATGEMFGERRIVESALGINGEGIARSIADAACRFSNGPQSDDITVVALKGSCV